MGIIITLLKAVFFVVIPFFVLVFIVYHIYESWYFGSEAFLLIKNRIQSYIKDCNELNQHIEALKDVSLCTKTLNRGTPIYHDTSKWNSKSLELKSQMYAPNVYNCSSVVCDGARRDPFKYICKYFNIDTDENTLEEFENILNNFEAVEDGKTALLKERKSILSSVKNDIPVLIKEYSWNKLQEKLGFDVVDLGTAYFPKYIFKYISPAGNKSKQCDIIMDIENLNKFILYLSEKVKFKKSAAGQRALMTSKLRQEIKKRDNFTCKECGISIKQEPHILLEIDHIIPISKGGLTTKDNLQTLCWRCNRSKGNKVGYS